jgi:hypothetical protein
MRATQMVSKLARANLHNLFVYPHNFILNWAARIIDSPKSTGDRVCAPGLADLRSFLADTICAAMRNLYGFGNDA